MEYMESMMQQRFDDFDEKVKSLDPFINDLIGIAKKHNIHNDDLKFVAELFEKRCMPPIESFNT